MDAFKIKNYEREHGPGTFVPFRHLSTREAGRVAENLREVLHFPNGISPKSMVQAIYDKSELVEGVNAGEEGFAIKSLLSALCLSLSETTYLNWYRYDDIDELRTDDLILHFDDLWYPSVDDVDVIDSKMQWLLLIEHHGAARFLRLKP